MIKKLNVAYTSDDYGNFPEKIVIDLSDSDLELINNAINFMKENKKVYSINVDCSIEAFDDEECTEESEFRIDAEYIIVYPSGRCFVYAQNKYTAQLNFESEEFMV